MATDRVDALVIFGATGDLAKLETFPALVGLVERGVLNVPIVGVAKSGWNLDQFRDYAAQSLRLNGMDPDAAPAAQTMLGLLRYVDGDLDDPATYTAMSHEMGSGRRALFYLEVPPFLFGRIAEGISAAGRADGARVMVEKPFGTDLGGAKALNATMHEVLPRGRDLPGRPLAGPRPAQQRPRRPVRQLDDRAAAQPHARREHPDHDGRGVRRRRPRPVLRPDRRHPRRRAEPHAAGAGHRPRRPAGRVGARRLVAGRQGAGRRRAPPTDPRGHGHAASTRATATSRASTRTRPRRSYVAVRLALDTWRWAGVPIIIRAGKTHAGHGHRGEHPIPARAVRRLRRRQHPDNQQPAVPHLAGNPDRPHPGREEAGRGARGRNCRTWCSPSTAGRTCARTTGSSAPPSTGNGCSSPGRTPWRPPGGSSTPCSATSSPCTPTPAAAGDRRRPTLCCPTATRGTTQPAEPRSSRSQRRAFVQHTTAARGRGLGGGRGPHPRRRDLLASFYLFLIIAGVIGAVGTLNCRDRDA